jgi:hypothetical protein
MWGLGFPALVGISSLAMAGGWLISLFVRAPRGWQDKRGWHRDRRQSLDINDGPWMRRAPEDSAS